MGGPGRRPGLALLFLVSGLVVFFPGITFAAVLPTSLRLGIQLTVIGGSLLVALFLRARSRRGAHWRVAFAYFSASLAVFLSHYAGDRAAAVSGYALDTVRGFTALKLGEDVAIVGTVVLLALLTRDDFRTLFLLRGHLRLGLAVGLSTFAALTLLGISLSRAQGIGPTQLERLMPAFIMIALADGFMEELLFRGLFLRRLGRLIGDGGANVVTAVVFALVHLQVQFAANLPVFLLIVFLLGLLWGWIIQRTGSILASALFHAGVDMLIIADALNAFGVET